MVFDADDSKEKKKKKPEEDENDDNGDEEEESGFDPLSSGGGKTYLDTLIEELHDFLDIPLTVRAELGRAKMTIRDVLRLQVGTVMELPKLVGEPMEISINNLLTARGEVVVVNERFGVRVTDVIDTLDIVRTSTLG